MATIIEPSVSLRWDHGYEDIPATSFDVICELASPSSSMRLLNKHKHATFLDETSCCEWSVKLKEAKAGRVDPYLASMDEGGQLLTELVGMENEPEIRIAANKNTYRHLNRFIEILDQVDVMLRIRPS